MNLTPDNIKQIFVPIDFQFFARLPFEIFFLIVPRLSRYTTLIFLFKVIPHFYVINSKANCKSK